MTGLADVDGFHSRVHVATLPTPVHEQRRPCDKLNKKVNTICEVTQTGYL